MSHVLHVIVTNKITLCEKYACFVSQNYEISHISENMFVVLLIFVKVIIKSLNHKGVLHVSVHSKRYMFKKTDLCLTCFVTSLCFQAKRP